MGLTLWLCGQSFFLLLLRSNAVDVPAPTAMYMLSEQYKAEDLTCNGNDGQMPSTQVYRTDPSGKAKGATSFEGMKFKPNQRVRIKNTGQLDFRCKFTILANLFAVDTDFISGTIVSWGPDRTGTVFYHTADNRIRLHIKGTSSPTTEKFFPRGYDLKRKAWYYVAASYDCKTQTGQLVVKKDGDVHAYSKKFSISGDIDTTGDVSIGGIPDYAFSNIPGALHCVRLYDKVLTKEQILAAEACTVGRVNNGKCSPSKCKNGATCQNLAQGFRCNNCPSGHSGFCCRK